MYGVRVSSRRYMSIDAMKEEEAEEEAKAEAEEEEEAEAEAEEAVFTGEATDVQPEVGAR